MDEKTEKMDLQGVKCPLNWAKAKVRLEYLERGDLLELLIDDPKGRRDIPRAAEAEGYAIVDIDELGEIDECVENDQAKRWRIVIEK